MWDCNLIKVCRYFLFMLLEGGNTFLWKVSTLIPNYMLSQILRNNNLQCEEYWNKSLWWCKLDTLTTEERSVGRCWNTAINMRVLWKAVFDLLADRKSASQAGFQSLQWLRKLSGVWIYRTAQSFKTIFEYGGGAKARRIQEKQVRRVTMTLHCNNAN